MKYFVLHWNDGQIQYISGKDIDEACHTSGVYIDKIVNSLERYEEAKEIPLENKVYKLVNVNWVVIALYHDTLCHNHVIEQIKRGFETVDIEMWGKIWKCSFEIKPFEVILKMM